MADAFQVDDDWKKQAQDEKRRIAEEQQKRQVAAPPPAAPSMMTSAAAGGAAPAAGGAKARGKREIPEASFTRIVQGLLTQVLLYLGDLASSGGMEGVNLDMAKLQVDTLNILEQKTANNLDESERRVLDAALYEARTRFISVASQYV